jgi:hypothetical protein
VRGRSLKGPLTGNTNTAYDPQKYICAGEMGGLGDWVRQGDFKAVVNSPPYGSGKLALFNVTEDSGETRDLSNVHPEMLKNAVEAWQRYAQEVGVVLPK